MNFSVFITEIKNMNEEIEEENKLQEQAQMRLKNGRR